MSDSGELNTRAELIQALTDAAELEQAVICQYLFAAYSLKGHPSEPGIDDVLFEQVRQWKADILGVARSEMEHLGLVCKLLSAVGGSPHFRAPSFPAPGLCCPPGGRFELKPFGLATLDRFIELERLHGEPGVGHDSIFDLYHRIRRGLSALDSRGKPLFVGEPDFQITSREIDLTPGWHDIELVPVTELTSAHAAIDRILEAGHSQADSKKPTHYERFLQTRASLLALRQTHPKFDPVRPVADNPVTHIHSGLGAESCTLIEHPITRQAAALFNAAYQATLTLMARFYTPSGESLTERLVLGKLAMYPLMTMVLRPLAEILTCLPVRFGEGVPTAGPTFELNREPKLHPHKRSAWLVLHEELLELVAQGDALRQSVENSEETWVARVLPRLWFLHENLQSIAVRFEHSMHVPHEQMQLNLRKLLE